jgi:hypothetical protein
MTNETTNIWAGCVGKKGECPCINFTWKKPNRRIIYTEENLTEEFSSDYNAKSLVTILNTIQYTKNGRESCITFPTGPRCIPFNNCAQRPDGMTIFNTLYNPSVGSLPKLRIYYILEYYEFKYKKCTLSPRRCVCKPHYRDHYCMSYSTFTHSPNGRTFKEFAERVAKDKNNGRFQLGVRISLQYPKVKGRPTSPDCYIKSKYSGIVMEDDPISPPPYPGYPWIVPPRSNCDFITSAGDQPPRPSCGELNYHLGSFAFIKGAPPANTPPLIQSVPVRVPF